MDIMEQAAHDNAHREFIRDLLHSVSRIMIENYDLKEVTIRPITASGSRLSTPIRLFGIARNGEAVRYFGKVMGRNDMLSLRYIQSMKNIYLQMNGQEPIFEIYDTAEAMVSDQYKTMEVIYKSGIPAIKPYGFHAIAGSRWLLVMEYLEARPLFMLPAFEDELMDTAFNYMTMSHIKGIYHGDIKPDNLLWGAGKIYILDAGHFCHDAPAEMKQAYDLACMICSFLERKPVAKIVDIAKNHYSAACLRNATDYIELVQMRPDIHFTDETKKELVQVLNG